MGKGLWGDGWGDETQVRRVRSRGNATLALNTRTLGSYLTECVIKIC